MEYAANEKLNPFCAETRFFVDNLAIDGATEAVARGAVISVAARVFNMQCKHRWVSARKT